MFLFNLLVYDTSPSSTFSLVITDTFAGNYRQSTTSTSFNDIVEATASKLLNKLNYEYILETQREDPFKPSECTSQYDLEEQHYYHFYLDKYIFLPMTYIVEKYIRHEFEFDEYTQKLEFKYNTCSFEVIGCKSPEMFMMLILNLIKSIESKRVIFYFLKETNI